jgi:hypothetical protein
MIPITVTEIPSISALRGSLARASFWDAYEAPLRNGGLSPTEIALKSFGATPLWVSWLMALRNGLVRLVGLKSVGALAVGSDKPASAYRVGDRLGIFTIQAMSDAEILMGIDDRHLDVRVSIVKPEAGEAPPRYVVSTVVHVHNGLGRLYMLPVGRIHPLVVRAMMRRAVV